MSLHHNTSLLKKYLIFIFVIQASFGFSQEINKKYIDSVLSILSIEKNKDIIVQKSFDLSNKIGELNPQTIDTLFSYIDNTTDNELIKMPLYNVWGRNLVRNGNVEKSGLVRHKSLKIAKKIKHIEFEMRSYQSLATFQVIKLNPDSVQFYANKQERLYDLYPNKLEKLRWPIYYAKAEAQKLIGNKEKQGYWFEQTWLEIDKTPNHPERGFILFVITDFFKNQKNYAKQAYYGDKLVEYFKKKNINTPNFHFPITSVFLKDETPQELEELKKVIAISNQSNNLSTLAACTNILANNYLKNGRAKEAIPYLENLVTKLNNANYPYNHSKDKELLQRAYAVVGDYKNAYVGLQKQKKMEDSLRKSEVLSKITEYEVKYETEKKEGQIRFLSLENEKNRELQRQYLYLGFAGLIILILLSFFYVRNRKKNRILYKQKRLLETVIDEKNILLQETHHRVKNSFQIVSSLLYLQSETIEDKQAKIAMQEAQNRVRSMVLIHQKLYSKDQLVGIGTQEYFTDLTKDIFESHQFEGNAIQYSLDVEDLVLDIETITPIGLILNELITNVIKHAFETISEESSMRIEFKKQDEIVLLKVLDNGNGMPSETKESSFGIKLIKALAKKLKASLHFSNQENGGTCASLEIIRFTEL